MKTSKNKKTGKKRVIIQVKEISYKDRKNVYGMSKSITVYDAPMNRIWKKILRALKTEPDIGYEVKPAKVIKVGRNKKKKKMQG